MARRHEEHRRATAAAAASGASKCDYDRMLSLRRGEEEMLDEEDEGVLALPLA